MNAIYKKLENNGYRVLAVNPKAERISSSFKCYVVAVNECLAIAFSEIYTGVILLCNTYPDDIEEWSLDTKPGTLSSKKP